MNVLSQKVSVASSQDFFERNLDFNSTVAAVLLISIIHAVLAIYILHAVGIPYYKTYFETVI